MKEKLILFFISFFIASCVFADESFVLPKGYNWETNEYNPILASTNAKKGGIYKTYITSYPLTFRLYGPQSNSGGFVGFNRRYAFLSLIDKHPDTRAYVPELATHWAVSTDKKVVFFKLDADSLWSDNKKITADDYVFTFNFLQSKFIEAPFYNQYIRDHIKSVEKVTDYIIRIELTKPSWRILEIANLNPLPRHDIKLDEQWVKNYQWKVPVVPGAYTIEKYKKGKYIEFHRNKDWWGYKKEKFQGMFNFDVIRINVTRQDDVALELFKKEKLSWYTLTPPQWVNKANFEEIKKGYILKQKFYRDNWIGTYGIFFNTADPIWSDVNLRKALAHSIDFENINKNILYNLNVRQERYFDNSAPYRKKTVSSYDFDLEKSNTLLEMSGWKRTATSKGYREKNGRKLILKVLYASEQHNPYLAYIKETALKAGIDIELKILDGASLFKSVEEKNYQGIVLAFGGGEYPAPRQFFHTENKIKGTNNINMFGNEEFDKLIETYEYNLDESQRIAALYQMENILHEAVPTVLFWKLKAQLFLRWRYIKGPRNLGTKRGINLDMLWYSRQEHTGIRHAIKSDNALPIAIEDVDPYNLK